MRSIGHLSWEEDSFFAKLELFFRSWKETRYRRRQAVKSVRADGYSALSSTYYTIAGTARAKLGQELKPLSDICWFFTWAPLGAWCFLRMLPLSNKAFRLSGGYHGLTAGKCDTRQCILRARHNYREAETCIAIALTKRSAEAHTRGLLRAGLVDICQHDGHITMAVMNVDLALTEAEIARETNPLQASRIYRQCARVVEKLGANYPSSTASELLAEARKLAEAASAKDQILKQSVQV